MTRTKGSVGKKKKVVTTENNVEPVGVLVTKSTIQPIAHEFGNGDMNVLRDKINEIIKSIS